MTFDEWWAAYDPDGVNTRADREHARMVWESAVAAERERCARAAEGHGLARYNADDEPNPVAALKTARKIAARIREGGES